MVVSVLSFLGSSSSFHLYIASGSGFLWCSPFTTRGNFSDVGSVYISLRILGKDLGSSKELCKMAIFIFTGPERWYSTHD